MDGIAFVLYGGVGGKIELQSHGHAESMNMSSSIRTSSNSRRGSESGQVDVVDEQ